MIGGMVGNNSCGANSDRLRHHPRARDLGPGLPERRFAFVTFGPLSAEEFAAKCAGPASLETKIYCLVRDILSDPRQRQLIRDNYPKPEVTRRNTGYALDRLMECAVFDPASKTPFNLCKLIAGSEGTLFFGVEYELNCEPLPPPGALMCAHFATINESLRGAIVAMRHRLFGCELIDRHILECTKRNLEHAKNRFFVQGDPGAVMVIEVRREDKAEIEAEMKAIEADLRAAGLGYAYPVLWGKDADRVWDLRRAGQGLMTNVIGDAKPREVVEDTAVALADLPDYIEEFESLMRDKYGIHCAITPTPARANSTPGPCSTSRRRRAWSCSGPSPPTLPSW